VQPCAPDAISAAASTRFSAQVTLARWYTSIANGMVRQAGVLLDAGAHAYDEQEQTSAAALGGGGSSGLGEAAVLPPGVSAALAVLQGGQPQVSPTSPAGEVPSSPRDIARLIDTGRTGPGPASWQSVAASLRGEADALAQAAQQLAAAAATAQQSWDSPAAQAAAARIQALQSWFESHASYVGGLAATAAKHVDDFHTATVEIPELAAVSTAERELQAANAANARSGGKFTPAVARAQVRLSALYTQAADGFKNYTFAASATSPHPAPTPPIWAPGQNPDPVPAAGRGDEPLVTHKTDTAPADAPPDPLDAGTGVGRQTREPGATWPPGAVDPSAVDLVPVDALSASAAPPQIVLAMVAGVVGGAGGMLGGLSGAGGKAMSMPASMMSGLGEPGGGAGPQHGGGEPEQSAPQPSPGSGDATPDTGGSGAEPGDTEPAAGGGGGGGALGAPQAVATPVAEAAPLSAPSAAAPPSERAGGAGSPMGAMVPPMMGGPHGGSGSAEDKQLYKDRELKVAPPPNSEPVKNRREVRGTRDGTAK